MNFDLSGFMPPGVASFNIAWVKVRPKMNAPKIIKKQEKYRKNLYFR